jgi:GTPase
METEEA